MKLSNLVSSLASGKVATVVAVGAIAALAGTGASVAAGHITSAQIKDGTIQTGDLTKNNFARFTSTENVVSATTPVSTVPAYGGARVVDGQRGQHPAGHAGPRQGHVEDQRDRPVLAHRSAPVPTDPTTGS